MLGKLIVFEGIDGSGKGTQSKKLHKKLTELGRKVVLFEFPFYSETFFGKEVGRYLNGEFGLLNEIHPKLAAMLYAGDRYEKRNEIIKKLEDGYLVICDRYIQSNIAHQTAKFADVTKRNELRSWIEQLEYDVYGLPKPDIIFFMNMNPNLSDSLVLKKQTRDYTNKKKDLHESDTSYLGSVFNIFNALATENRWVGIACQDKDGRLRSMEDIHHDILKILETNTIGVSL